MEEAIPAEPVETEPPPKLTMLQQRMPVITGQDVDPFTKEKERERKRKRDRERGKERERGDSPQQRNRPPINIRSSLSAKGSR